MKHHIHRMMNLQAASTLNRRDFVYGLGSSIGAVAFSSLLGCDKSRPRNVAADPLAPKSPRFPVKVKSCIFLMMEGGPSHIDTFDPKPKLHDLHMKKFRQQGENLSAMSSGDRYFVESPFKTRRVGKSGLDMCEHFVHLAGVADDLCVYKGAQAESVNHPTAMYHINTGNKFAGDPAIGSWVSYGLGTLNQNLPAFIVLPELAYPQGGGANWSNGYLPAHFQGTPLRSVGSPILDIHPPPGVSRYHQKEELELLTKFNAAHAEAHASHDELNARIANYELAFRMQMEVPGIINIDEEEEKTKELYGVGEEGTDAFGRKCLLARRLVEQGVRFVQIYSGGWDSHDYLGRAHGNLIRSVDKPIAGLIKDLKRRGMLEETLIIWCGEFGRSPDNGVRSGEVAYGRDHNSNAMVMWFAGGGVKAGESVGATDEIGATAVEVVHPLKDVHVTILRLMGLDDNKLTYFHGGRFKQLSQTGGVVIPELLVH